MPKTEKVKVNVKDKVDDNTCDLSLCGLTEIPVKEINNFTTLTRLVKLDLSKNQLKSLPEEFGALILLRHLVLYDNVLEHLPLSFGNLTNLRYLDLKGNPLTTSLAKVVGYCLTSKDCQEAAKKTIKFLAQMQQEASKATYDKKTEVNSVVPSEDAQENELTLEVKNKLKKQSKRVKNRRKKTQNNATKNILTGVKNEIFEKQNPVVILDKLVKPKKSNGNTKKLPKENSTAFVSIFIFFFLLFINIGLIYILMFKRPEIAEALANYIPPQYRDWILTKSEIFRLRISDWITEFRTPPEEH
ncbi:leucine-rich repeat-containing protein 59 isoform X2 [Teleopsis dalmanni]|uniref:leucine-rich repeat-containing protein 59 isoform X2 n=1 Tax=Teleopsis dalmanni TaxID=139649 RepID=UPI0018CD3333|nr:leucine-rich repeat-containing protein 59 isoform X2 [Teleopsis dalmanni]